MTKKQKAEYLAERKALRDFERNFFPSIKTTIKKAGK